MQFVAPLWGFVGESSYALLPAAREGLWWLMSVEAPFTTFVLADPFPAFADYAIDLSDSDREALQLTSPDAAMALVMLTLPADAEQPVTANLRAPIVFHVGARRAMQVVSANDRHSLKEPVALSVYPLRDAGTPSSS